MDIHPMYPDLKEYCKKYYPNTYYFKKIVKFRCDIENIDLLSETERFKFIIKNYEIIKYYILRKTCGHLILPSYYRDSITFPIHQSSHRFSTIDGFIFDNYFLFRGVSKNTDQSNNLFLIWNIKEISAHLIKYILSVPVQKTKDINIRTIRKHIENYKCNGSVEIIREEIEKDIVDIPAMKLSSGKFPENMTDDNIKSLLLSSAIVLQDIDCIHSILESTCVNILTQTDGTGYSPISRALWKGSRKIFDLIKHYIQKNKDKYEFKKAHCGYEETSHIIDAIRSHKLRELNSIQSYMDILDPLFVDTNYFLELLVTFYKWEKFEKNSGGIHILNKILIEYEKTGNILTK